MDGDLIDVLLFIEQIIGEGAIEVRVTEEDGFTIRFLLGRNGNTSVGIICSSGGQLTKAVAITYLEKLQMDDLIHVMFPS